MHHGYNLKRISDIVKVAFVAADLNPIISEPIRFASLFGVQSLFHNVLISAVVFGGVTLLLDAVGTIALVDLIERKRTAKLIDKTRELIKKLGLSKLLNVETTFGIDFSITLLVGTPITIMIKQWQDPERKRAENMKLGLFLSTLASLVSILQGGAIVAGLWHPNSLNLALAVVAIASFLAVPRWLKQRFS
jgi:hypothetical protein